MFDPNADRPVCIYCLWCPLARRIRYIGKTVYPERRIRDHINAAIRGETTHNAARWIRKLLAAGLKPRMRILVRINPPQTWTDIEIAIIARAIAKGWHLTNQCAGGNNPVFLSEDHAESARRRKSESLKASWKDPEVRRRRSEGIRAAWADPEYHARMLVTLKDAANTPERIEQLTKAARKAVTPAREIARLAAVKAYWADPENKRRHAERTSQRMLGGQARMMAAKRFPQP